MSGLMGDVGDYSKKEILSLGEHNIFRLILCIFLNKVLSVKKRILKPKCFSIRFRDIFLK